MYPIEHYIEMEHKAWAALMAAYKALFELPDAKPDLFTEMEAARREWAASAHSLVVAIRDNPAATALQPEDDDPETTLVPASDRDDYDELPPFWYYQGDDDDWEDAADGEDDEDDEDADDQPQIAAGDYVVLLRDRELEGVNLGGRRARVISSHPGGYVLRFDGLGVLGMRTVVVRSEDVELDPSPF